MDIRQRTADIIDKFMDDCGQSHILDGADLAEVLLAELGSAPSAFEVLTAIDTDLGATQERVAEKIWRQRLAGETVDAYQSGYHDAIASCRRKFGLS